MVTITLTYARYTLAALSSLGFGIHMNQPFLRVRAAGADEERTMTTTTLRYAHFLIATLMSVGFTLSSN